MEIVFVLRNLYIVLYEKSPDCNKCGIPSDDQFEKNLGQHLIVIVFREI